MSVEKYIDLLPSKLAWLSANFLDSVRPICCLAFTLHSNVDFPSANLPPVSVRLALSSSFSSQHPLKVHERDLAPLVLVHKLEQPVDPRVVHVLFLHLQHLLAERLQVLLADEAVEVLIKDAEGVPHADSLLLVPPPERIYRLLGPVPVVLLAPHVGVGLGLQNALVHDLGERLLVNHSDVLAVDVGEESVLYLLRELHNFVQVVVELVDGDESVLVRV